MTSKPLLTSELSSLYALFDINGDGSITATEVEHVLTAMAPIITPAEADALRQLMRDQRSIHRDDFLAWARHQPELGTQQVLRDLFDLLDADRNGWLCREELSWMLRMLFPTNSANDAQRLAAQLDRDGDGQISTNEFLDLLDKSMELGCSLADLKRLKKKLIQVRSAAQLKGVTLVEVDCDLGAGIPGASSGIELLKNTVQRHSDLLQLSESLIEEIRTGIRASTSRDDLGTTITTPHARHIETITKVMHDAAGLVATTLEQGSFPLVLAGDHSTAASTIAGIRRAHPQQRLGVIWIDAHADIHSPFTTPSGNMHGMPLAIASRHDNLPEAINDPDATTRSLWNNLQQLHGSQSPAISLHDLIYVGVRDTESAEDITLAKHAIPVIGTADIRRDGATHVAKQCLSYLSEVDLIYVSLDVDALDSTICKGTGTPVPDGLWAHEAMLLIKTLLTDPRVCCWEICEINPHLDVLNTLAEVSLSLYRAGMEVLAERFTPTSAEIG